MTEAGSERLLRQHHVLHAELRLAEEGADRGDRPLAHHVRLEPDGLRCPFHGWKFDAAGQCTDTPGEPTGSTLCQRVRQRSYPVLERAGVVFAWLGPEGMTPPPLPAATRPGPATS